MSRGWWRAVQAAGGALILFFVTRDIIRNWDQVRSARLEWSFNLTLVLASAALTWAMYAVLIASWRGFLRDWGGRLRWWPAARIWAVSSLGKYIPGKVWAIAGMALLARRAGAPAWAATASAILMQGLAVGTGVIVVALAGVTALEQGGYPHIRNALWALAVASAIGTAFLVSGPSTRWLLRRFGAEPGAQAPRTRTILAGVLANGLAWCGYGVAFWLLARGVLPQSVPPLRVAVGAFVASYLAGLLFLLAPGGLVVRESVMLVMLQPAIGVAPAAALAVASRLLLTVTEVGLAGLFLLVTRETPRVTP